MFTSKVVFNKNNHLSKEGTAPVYIRLTYARKSTYYHTNIFIRPDQWNGTIIKHRYQFDLNREIENMVYVAQSYYRSCRVNKIPFVLSECKKHIGIDVSPDKTFSSIMKTLIEDDEPNIAFSTHQKRIDALGKLLAFKDPVLLSDLDYNFMVKFNSHMMKLDSKRGGKISQNYIASIMTIVKKYINECVKMGELTHNPIFGFKSTTTAKVIVVHTPEEIERLYDEHRDDYLNRCRLIYCFLLFTGSRYSDIFNLSSKNFDEHFLKYLAGKTKKSKGKIARVPLKLFDGRAKIIFDQLGGKIPYYSNKTFNTNIKLLMDDMKIDKYVTAHTARHTFKSVMLERGYSLSYIAEMMAHSSIATTESYGSISDRALLE